MGKKWDEVRVYNKGVKASELSLFSTTVPIFDRFRKYTSIKNTIGSGLKRVFTGSISKIYQTSLFAHISKPLLENVNFDLIYPIFNIPKPPSKTTRYGIHLPKEDVSSYFVG